MPSDCAHSGTDDLVHGVTLLRRRSDALRLDVVPFAAAYLSLLPALLGILDRPPESAAVGGYDVISGYNGSLTWKVTAHSNACLHVK